MPVIATVIQQPSDREDYDIDFSDWFPLGDTIVSATVVYSPVFATNNLSVTYAISSPKVKVWVAGGVDKATYKITLTAQTVGGRSKEVELRIKIKDD